MSKLSARLSERDFRMISRVFAIGDHFLNMPILLWHAIFRFLSPLSIFGATAGLAGMHARIAAISPEARTWCLRWFVTSSELSSAGIK